MRILIAGVSTLSLLATTACGSSSAGTGSKNGEISIGLQTPLTGANALIGKEVQDGMQARIDLQNSTGGIQGHKVKLVAVDDQLDPAKAPGAVRTLVESKNVLAMSTSGSASAAATLPYLTQHSVLNIPTGSSSDLIKPSDSPFRLFLPGYDQLGAGTAAYAVNTLHKTRIAVAYTPDAVGLPTLAGAKAELQKLGLPLVADVSFSATATSAAAQAATLKAAKADFVITNSVPSVTSVIIKACEQIGYKPTWGGGYPLADPGLTKLVGKGVLDDRVYVLTPFSDPMSDESATMREWVKKRGADVTSIVVIDGWDAADVLIAAITKAVENSDGGIPSRQDVLKATDGLTIDDNYVHGVKWTADNFRGTNTVRVVGIKNDKFVEIRGFEGMGIS